MISLDQLHSCLLGFAVNGGSFNMVGDGCSCIVCFCYSKTTTPQSHAPNCPVSYLTSLYLEMADEEDKALGDFPEH